MWHFRQRSDLAAELDAIAVAAVQHGRFIATLPAHDRPAQYSLHWSLWLSALVSIASLLLAGYLGLTLQ